MEGEDSEHQPQALAAPGRRPPSSQYLGGGFDEPVLLPQGRDDGDVAHRLIGVLLVLGGTHTQSGELSQAPTAPLCLSYPLLGKDRQTEFVKHLVTDTAC